MILLLDETGNCSVFMTWAHQRAGGAGAHKAAIIAQLFMARGGREGGWGGVGDLLPLQAPSLFVLLAWVSKVSESQSIGGAKPKFVSKRFISLALAVEQRLWSRAWTICYVVVWMVALLSLLYQINLGHIQ